MDLDRSCSDTGPDPSFKIFHDLMRFKVREILLVSSLYDAFLLEEDSSLATRIISQYRGLNLSQPPRVTRASSAREALALIAAHHFDLVITMPHIDDMDALRLGAAVKQLDPTLAVILLAHNLRDLSPWQEATEGGAIDNGYVWSANYDLLFAAIKNVEDHRNADHDTETAMVRVLLLVEDSPLYRSTILPVVYQQVVAQTQAVLDESLNEEHRLLKMRARPKILLAASYEEACRLYRRYRPYLFGIISDSRYPRQGRLDDRAGWSLLHQVRQEIPDLPLLLISSEPHNRQPAVEIPAVFVDKNSPTLTAEIEAFFLSHLGFGDFVFRLPSGREVGRAANLHDLDRKICAIPAESLAYHAERNHFSNWLMARSEIGLASRLSTLKLGDFRDIDELRQFLRRCIHALRRHRQQGVVVRFNRADFDSEVMDFVKIGSGSLGGKARGLAFMANLLRQNQELAEKIAPVRLQIPQTCVVGADGFDSFVVENHLQYLLSGYSDSEIRTRFLAATMPAWLVSELEVFLRQVRYPLAVRSSSLLEDARYKPYAGLFHTFMLANNQPDFGPRLEQLLLAIKLVYASAYYAGPRAFANSSLPTPPESMAVIIQQLVGAPAGDFFYPALSGVAQSYNYYPVARMKAEEGVASIAAGFGKTVVEGENCLRFAPKYPRHLPQFSEVRDILANAQRYFYCLQLRGDGDLDPSREANLVRREIGAAAGEFPLTKLVSTYIPAEDRIRDSLEAGPKVVTFAQILRYKLFPLPEILIDLLELGRKGMGCPVEMEFAVNLQPTGGGEFYFLQIRPMVAGQDRQEVSISEEERAQAFCVSGQALGHGRNEELADIVYVKPDSFKAAETRQVAEEIGRINGALQKEGRPYLLIGPGRWGSADPWLGIPVQWQDISGVGAIIELRNDQLKADPSQGSHFFQNITSLGIHYLTVEEGGKRGDRLDWQFLATLPVAGETAHLRHLRLTRPLVLQIDGRESRGIIGLRRPPF